MQIRRYADRSLTAGIPVCPAIFRTKSISSWIRKQLFDKYGENRRLSFLPMKRTLLKKKVHSRPPRHLLHVSNGRPLGSDHFIIWGGAGRVFEKIIWRCFWPKKIIWPSLYVEKIFLLWYVAKKKSCLHPENNVNIFDLKHDYKKIIWLSILCEKKNLASTGVWKKNPALNIRWKNNLLKTTLPAPPPR